MDRFLSVLVSCFLLTIHFCYSQNFNTPEVSSFKEEVFKPFSYYTGQANISIPLTQIQTNEITVPITLNYVGGAGFKPANPYSSTGMGWRVTAGGMISRTRNGVSDESTSTNNGSTTNGFFSLAPNTITNSYVRNNVSSYIGTDASGKYFMPATEYSPDVFSFSFLGYSGYFIMGYDGQFKIQSQDIVSVEKINNVTLPNLPNSIAFKLVANDGTEFTFGGSEGSLELSGGSQPGIPYQFDAWYITKIKSANGREIVFKYKGNDQTFVRFSTSSAPGFTFSNCPVVLDNIVFNGGKVLFTSATVTQYIYGSASYPRMINKVELMDSDNKVVSTSDFIYTNQNSQRYYFLETLTIDGKPYTFGYYNRSSLPDTEPSYGTDYWGFYNLNTEVTSVGTGNVSSFWDMYMNPTVTYPKRQPSLESTKLGILTTITYPTGGVETYDYELNTYSYLGVQRLGGTVYDFSEEPKTAGGLRIAKITLGNMVRKYKYVNSFNPNNPDYIPGSMSYIGFSSSGFLYRLPGVPYHGRSVANALSIDGEPAVVYGKVIEFLSDKSYTEYKMRSPLDKPDRDNATNPSYYAFWFSQSGMTSYKPAQGFVGSLGKPSSTSLERGQVSSMKVYDGANALRKSVTYTYATDPNRFNQNVPVLNIVSTADQTILQLSMELGLAYFSSGMTFSIFHSYEVYTFPVYLEQEIETVYEAGDSLKKTTQYVYNAQKLRSEISFANSSGENIKTKIKYPADISTGVYPSMVAKKMINFPIERIQLENNLVTASKLDTYKAHVNGHFVPDKKYILEIRGPLAESGFTLFNGTARDSRYNTTPEISYDSYSLAGNVTQTTTRDGIVTSYLWDGLGVYPMANVKGATYSSIGTQDSKPAGYSSPALYSSIKSLVPTALISTYSYKPLVGMAATTDVRGSSTYYNYDQYNRLALVRDNESNIVKKICYNYQGQVVNCDYFGNDLSTSTKRRNNCTGCQIGSSVTYTVPANTYFSSTLVGANALAQNDINANAQILANASGTCTASVMVSLLSSNLQQNKSFSVKFHNNCTNADYYYTMNANTSNVALSPQLPTGNYNVTFTPVGGGSSYYGYWVNGYYEYAQTGNILGVDVVAGSNDVRVYP